MEDYYDHKNVKCSSCATKFFYHDTIFDQTLAPGSCARIFLTINLIAHFIQLELLPVMIGFLHFVLVVVKVLIFHQ